MNRSIVLLSGGLDSSVNLAKAVRETEVILSLTFDYGQKARKKEIAASKELSDFYGVKNMVIELPFLKDITKTALVNNDEDIPLPTEKELDNNNAFDTAAQVWVPNRNGLFANIAACYAESQKCDIIITGFNAEEAVTFPDNSPEFVESCNTVFNYSTQQGVRLVSYTIDMNKKEIVKLGRELGLPFEYIWSCYTGNDEPCGKCESCLRLQRCLDDGI